LSYKLFPGFYVPFPDFSFGDDSISNNSL